MLHQMLLKIHLSASCAEAPTVLLNPAIPQLHDGQKCLGEKKTFPWSGVASQRHLSTQLFSEEEKHSVQEDTWPANIFSHVLTKQSKQRVAF